MLDLFVLKNCPYCKKVIELLDSKGFKYNTFDISNKHTEDALIKIGGKRQVPFLIDKDRNIQMYESNDIIEYIKTLL